MSTEIANRMADKKGQIFYFFTYAGHSSCKLAKILPRAKLFLEKQHLAKVCLIKDEQHCDPFVFQYKEVSLY
jgi:hypothetical protein